MTSRLIEVKSGEILFREGDPSKKIYIVKEGLLMVFRRHEDLDIPLEILKVGDLIGSVSLFTSEPRSASVRALSPSILESYEEIDPQVFLSGVPPWVLAVFKDVATRLKRMDQLLVDTRKSEKSLKRQQSNRYTYAAVLCRLLKALVEARAGGEILQVNFSIEDFAHKASSILLIKEELLKEIFQVLLQSAYLKSEYNSKNELSLQSPRIDHIEHLAFFLEQKSQQKQTGQWIPSEYHFYKALRSVAGKTEEVLKEMKVWIHEMTDKLDQKIPPEFIQRAQAAGIIISEKTNDIEKVWINREALDVRLDCEKIALELSKLYFAAEEESDSVA